MDSMRSADVVIDHEQYISEPTSSNVTSREGPPKEYEEIIQALEGDIRKHIRIEQQLKLHIETVEGQLDQLELENERLVAECQRLDQVNTELEWDKQRALETCQSQVAGLRQELQDLENKHKLEMRGVDDRT